MSDDVKPALTAEEWAKFAVFRSPAFIASRDGDWVRNGHGYIDVAELGDEPGDRGATAMVNPEARHALAALALHGQLFGFTWEDVDTLRSEARWLPASKHRAEFILTDLADRIAALLPPREDDNA